MPRSTGLDAGGGLRGLAADWRRGLEAVVGWRLLGTDEGGEVVEAVALVAGDDVAVAVVGPGSDEEHLPAGTGIEHISAGFPHGRETVFK